MNPLIPEEKEIERIIPVTIRVITDTRECANGIAAGMLAVMNAFGNDRDILIRVPPTVKPVSGDADDGTSKWEVRARLGLGSISTAPRMFVGNNSYFEIEKQP